MAKKRKTKAPSPDSGQTGPITVDVSKLPKIQRAELPLLWVDRMEVSLRGDTPVAMLRFYSVLGNEAILEACRIQTSAAHLRSMVDVLSKTVGYYPERPR